jgi:hypothetical protein
LVVVVVGIPGSFAVCWIWESTIAGTYHTSTSRADTKECTTRHCSTTHAANHRQSPVSTPHPSLIAPPSQAHATFSVVLDPRQSRGGQIIVEMLLVAATLIRTRYRHGHNTHLVVNERKHLRPIRIPYINCTAVADRTRTLHSPGSISIFFQVPRRPCRWPQQIRLPSSTVCLCLSRVFAHTNPSQAEDPSRPASPAPPPPSQDSPQAPSTRGTQKARGGPASRGGRYYPRGGKPRESNNEEPAANANTQKKCQCPCRSFPSSHLTPLSWRRRPW